jgi:hypothetical protein
MILRAGHSLIEAALTTSRELLNMNSTYRPLFRFGLVVVALVLATAGRAEDAYFVESLDKLTITEGKLPDSLDYTEKVDSRSYNYMYGWARDRRFSYVVLDGEGEAYVGLSTLRHPEAWWKLAVRAPTGKKVTGRLWIPHADVWKGGMVAIRFEIDPAKGKAENKEAFLKVKRAHYEELANANLPGAAWFRHQDLETERALGIDSQASARDDRDRERFGNRDFGDTFSLATGGQALAENLQLDRVLPQSKSAPETVDLSTVTGITIREFDWSKYVEGKKPKTDALATLIPADQHAIFLPTFDALMALADHADRFGTPVLRAAEPRSDDAGVRKRYERQLCLPASAISRLLGPKLINSVAVTGGDPYLTMGSDIAILFEAKNHTALRTLINARVALGANDYKAAKAVSGEVAGVKYNGVASSDRVICSYVATLGDAVVVTNSLAQLERLANVHAAKTASLASLAEYTFFRDRYPLGDANESGLLILSDATIRRWCGPKWRIADSRRVRAAAVMSELQAQNLDRIAKRETQEVLATSRYALPDAGEFKIDAAGTRSSVYGRLDFMTPIGELDLPRVTKEEARLYELWREGYQRNWSQFFDPIAVRFFVSNEKLSLDTTVMPLIDSTQYREAIEISSGAKLAATAGDPHAEAAIHFALALNKDSTTLKRFSQFLPTVGGVKVDVLSWLGDTLSIYADSDPIWAKMAKAESTDEFLRANVDRMPVAFRVEVRDNLKLALFLTALRGYIDQTAPGMINWESREHQGVSYVRMSPTAALLSGGPDDANGLKELAVYYVPSGGALTITLREDMLKRAIDRQIARGEVKPAGDAKPTDDKPADTKPDPAATADKPAFVPRPWLGDHWCIRADRSAIQLFDGVWAEPQRREMQRLAWANIPILNEWRRLYPAENSIAFHERLWNRKLVCPGGGEYQWNEKWQTYESTAYGHSGEPKIGPTLAAGLRDINSADFGLTFEPDGLRARAEVIRATEAPK